MMKHPKDWKVLRLAEAAEVIDCKHKTPRFTSNGVPIMSTGDIAWGNLNLNDCRFVTEADYNELMDHCTVEVGDVVMSRNQSVGVGAFVDVARPFALGQDMVLIKPLCKHKRYLYHFLESDIFQRHLSRASGGSTFSRINLGALRELPVVMPNDTEQKGISDILAHADYAIDRYGILLAAKLQRKQGLMQQLLTGQTRFRAFKSERWRKVRVSDVFEQVTRRNSTGCVRVLTGSGEHGLIDQRDYYSRRVASDDVSGYYLVKRGEFAYNRSSSNGYPFGAIKRLDAYDEGVLSTLYLVFRIRDRVAVDSNFLDHTFEGGFFIAQLGRLCREGARSHGLLNITADEFFSMHMQLPSVAEQQRIEAVLSACDEEIKLLKKQLEALKEQKRGLMQKLLTGEVRVKV